MVHLPASIENFGFVEREKRNGKNAKYKCGRDFLYYALHYLRPQQFNPHLNNPTQIERKGYLGVSLPHFLAWTQLQFLRTPEYLRGLGLQLSINDRKICSFRDFVSAILFSRMDYETAVRSIENHVSNGEAVGLDLAMRFQGLEDHVLFVYGFDGEHFYVCDTHQLPGLEYEKMRQDRYFMKLSKDVVRRRWKRFSRVWHVAQV